MWLEDGSLQCGLLPHCGPSYASVSSSSGRQEIDTCNTIQCELSGNRRYATLSSRKIVGGVHYNDAVKLTPATS